MFKRLIAKTRSSITRGELEACGISRTFQELTWKDYVGSNEVKRKVKTYASKFSQFRKNGYGLILIGGPQTGKTMLACLLAKHVLWLKKSVHVIRLSDLTAAMYRRDEEDEQTSVPERMSLYCSVDLLVVDELVATPSSEKDQYLVNDGMRTALNHVLRCRHHGTRPTILTTTLEPYGDTDSINALFGGSVMRMIDARFATIHCPDSPRFIQKQKKKLNDMLES